ncbi:MAG: DUF2382 domain-containing protein [Acidobacteriaceae bacterium]|nr:DUF2382 domain-containing protein [Acidobacteriaceae bacterium]MBV9780563.1 DUF2382 domain-containing protein [Acidobacteriaceae bacterium]
MPTMTASTVVAFFRNIADAQAAAAELRANGFNNDEIYISSTSESEGSQYRETKHEGGIAGWFKRVFGSDDQDERSYYETAVNRGNVLLSVDTDEENSATAAEILNRHSPVDVQRDDPAATTNPRAKRSGTKSSDVSAGQSKAVPVVEEQLKVGKRAVMRGGVRVYSRVVEQPVEETVNLREEKVRVERQPVNRPVRESDYGTGRDEVIEVKEYAEEPVVSKEARVVEEVRINKEATSRKETVRDTVRRTEVNVENLGRGEVQGRGSPVSDIDQDFRTHYAVTYAGTGDAYESYAPAYRYGSEMANDPRYQGKDFNEVESDLRAEYGRAYPNSTWEKMKDSVRYGWNKVTGRSSSATASR